MPKDPVKPETSKKATQRKTMDGFSRVKKPIKTTQGTASQSVKKPVTQSAKKSATKPALKVAEAPERPAVASRGRFIDFSPSHSKTPLMALKQQNGGLTPAEKAKIAANLPSRRPTPDRPIDHPPVPRPPRTRPPRPEPVKVIEEFPKNAAVRRPPRSRVPIKRPVRITTARSNMPQMETPTKVVQHATIVTTADGVMPEITSSRSSHVRQPMSFSGVTRSGAVTMPASPGTLDRHDSEISDDGFFKDSSPLMSDEDLSIALAGFADDPEDNSDFTSPLTDNLSREAAAFAEEIEALDDIDEIEDFVSEPKALFEDDESDDSEEKRDDSNRRDNRSKFPTYRPPSLNGKSPFLSSVTVEKRPLSSATAVTTTAVTFEDGEIIGGRLAKSAKATQKEKNPLKLVRPKNVYAKRQDDDSRDDGLGRKNSSSNSPRETLIIATPESKTHNIGLLIAIALTILLGVGVGALIYLMFF